MTLHIGSWLLEMYTGSLDNGSWMLEQWVPDDWSIISMSSPELSEHNPLQPGGPTRGPTGMLQRSALQQEIWKQGDDISLNRLSHMLQRSPLQHELWKQGDGP